MNIRIDTARASTRPRTTRRHHGVKKRACSATHPNNCYAHSRHAARLLPYRRYTVPRNQLTTADRRKAATTTNTIIAERKAKRQTKVKELLDGGLPKNEIAKRLGVRPETISRDVRELKAKGKL